MLELAYSILSLLILIKYVADYGRATKVEILWWSRPRSRILSGQFCHS
jgi:hypothetical protein